MKMFHYLLVLTHIVMLFQLFRITTCGADEYQNYTCIQKYGKYTKDSTYETNLKNLMSSIKSANTLVNHSLIKYSVGEGIDKVNGVAFCRGDVAVESCQECLEQATFALPRLCTTLDAFIMYDQCIVRYSNRSIFGMSEEQPVVFFSYGDLATNESYRNERQQALIKLLRRLQNQTASREDKFATGMTRFRDNELSIYALCQCRSDMSQKSCFNCLGSYIDKLLSCCADQTGLNVYGLSCLVKQQGTLFYNVPSPPFISSTNSSTTPGKRRKKRNTWIVVGTMTLLFMLLSILVYWYGTMKRKLHKQVEGNDDEIKCVDSLQFDLDTIQVATDDFSDSRRIGQGSSAIVYKGVLPSGQEVAVKRLHKLGKEGEAKFNNEVMLSANLQHKSLVKFVGFCVKKKHKFLIYEFFPNGSLDLFLEDPVKREQLDWETRCIMIQGIARGLLYLHEDSQLRVIHRDLKPTNILLNLNMTPKISNFCKASLDHANHTRGSTSAIKGTFGYMAPEYVLRGNFSIKSDVFSFGVILLEIISGQTISTFSDEENNQSLTIHAWKKWSEGKAMDIVDQTMLNIQNYAHEITRCINIALLCVQANPTYRPTMSNVVLMLNSDKVPIPEPSKPGFMIQDEADHSSQTSNSHLGYVNEASITDIEPR